MSLKSKAKAAAQREKNKKLRLQEQQQNEARVQALKNMSSGFARTPRTSKIEQQFQQSKIPVYERRSTVAPTRSLDERFPISVPKVVQQLSEEMQQREAAAKERYAEMKTRVGQAFNKSGYSYLSDGELAAQKKGELRRRS
jgi:hypothetical protein